MRDFLEKFGVHRTQNGVTFTVISQTNTTVPTTIKPAKASATQTKTSFWGSAFSGAASDAMPIQAAQRATSTETPTPRQ